MTSLNAQVEELARMDNQYEAGFVVQENKQAVNSLSESHWREITADAQSPAISPVEVFARDWHAGKTATEFLVRRRVSNVRIFKFHQLGNHSQARLQVGHTRIVFISELFHHPLKLNSSNLDLILN